MRPYIHKAIDEACTRKDYDRATSLLLKDMSMHVNDVVTATRHTKSNPIWCRHIPEIGYDPTRVISSFDLPNLDIDVQVDQFVIPRVFMDVDGYYFNCIGINKTHAICLHMKKIQPVKIGWFKRTTPMFKRAERHLRLLPNPRLNFNLKALDMPMIPPIKTKLEPHDGIVLDHRQLDLFDVYMLGAISDGKKELKTTVHTFNLSRLNIVSLIGIYEMIECAAYLSNL